MPSSAGPPANGEAPGPSVASASRDGEAYGVRIHTDGDDVTVTIENDTRAQGRLQTGSGFTVTEEFVEQRRARTGACGNPALAVDAHYRGSGARDSLAIAAGIVVAGQGARHLQGDEAEQADDDPDRGGPQGEHDGVAGVHRDPPGKRTP
jgi:hypothetical protein